MFLTSLKNKNISHTYLLFTQRTVFGPRDIECIIVVVLVLVAFIVSAEESQAIDDEVNKMNVICTQFFKDSVQSDSSP